MFGHVKRNDVIDWAEACRSLVISRKEVEAERKKERKKYWMEYLFGFRRTGTGRGTEDAHDRDS